ncbi:MAG TPA: sulfite exporter TauE/SafE family protein [Acidimicrobiia bacterium]|nr:sulfite exporter TauE/SafE family protein [Acidimicrobiia bacterium]
MHIELGVMFAGLLVGFVVGLTGMGGGALMTPVLVLLFRINPLAAVSSDIAAAVVMKPVGGGVHLRRGTVNVNLVRWLAIGSVPAAFCGVFVLRAVGAPEFGDRLKILLGAVLLVAAAAIGAKSFLQSRRPAGGGIHAITVRPARTVLIGVIGGLVVGMTSVGSGSVMIVLLMLLYPALSSNELVGTDLVQAIPLVLAAAIGHLFFGDLQLGLTLSLVLGSVPGVYLGARVSSRAPDRIIRPVLVAVLTVSALALLGVPNEAILAIFGAAGLGALVTYAWRRATNDTWGELTRDTYDESCRDVSA